LPDLDLVLDYSRFGIGDSLEQSTSHGVDAWAIGLRSRTDVARTVERAAYGQSLVATRSARRGYDLQTDQVVSQVKRELRNLDRSEQRILIQQDKREQAKRQLALASLKFRHGLATNFDLIDAETELRRSEVSLVSSRIDYILGTYRLRGAMGTLLGGPDGF
jgi:outer membrane protein TolC